MPFAEVEKIILSNEKRLGTLPPKRNAETPQARTRTTLHSKIANTLRAHIILVKATIFF